MVVLDLNHQLTAGDFAENRQLFESDDRDGKTLEIF